MLTRSQCTEVIGITNQLARSRVQLSINRNQLTSGPCSKTAKPSLSTYSSFYPPLRQSSFSPSITSRLLHIITVLLRWTLLIPLWVGVFKLSMSLIVIVAQAVIDGINHIRRQHPHRWQPKRHLMLYKQTEMATPRVGRATSLADKPAFNHPTDYIDHLNIDDESGEIPAIYNRLDDGAALSETAQEELAQASNKRAINQCTTLSNTSLGLGWLVLMMLLLVIVTWSDLSTIALG